MVWGLLQGRKNMRQETEWLGGINCSVMARGQKRRHRKTSAEERLRGSTGEEMVFCCFFVLFFYWMSPSESCCKECPETLNIVQRHDVSSSTPAASPLLVSHTHTQTLQCKYFLPVAGLASFRSKIRAKELYMWKGEASCAVISTSKIRMTTFLYLDIL